MASEASPSRIKRLRNMDAGAEAGKAWLESVLARGIANLSPADFEAIEHRMVDAQAAGFARKFWLLGELVGSREGWESDFVEEAGLLYLLLDSFQRRESLPEALRDEVLRAGGITVDRRQLEMLPQTQDVWDLAIQRTFKEQRLVARRSWLWGRDSRRWVCLQQYRISTQPFDVNYQLGAAYSGLVAMYPGSAQTRGALLSHESCAFQTPPAGTYSELADRWSDLLARFPWAESIGGAVKIAQLSHGDDEWLASDPEGKWFPIEPMSGWRIAAYLGCSDIALYGEWNGKLFTPTCISVQGGFYAI